MKEVSLSLEGKQLMLFVAMTEFDRDSFPMPAAFSDETRGDVNECGCLTQSEIHLLLEDLHNSATSVFLVTRAVWCHRSTRGSESH